MSDRTENGRFMVVQNAELQFSIWPLDTSIPPGWVDVGVHGDRAACLAHIEGAWTDMRPLSLRGGAPARSSKQ